MGSQTSDGRKLIDSMKASLTFLFCSKFTCYIDVSAMPVDSLPRVADKVRIYVRDLTVLIDRS